MAQTAPTRSTRPARAAWRTALAVVVLTGVAACGGDQASGPTPLDRSGAETLAGVLFGNYSAGGGDFRMIATLQPSGDTIEYEGTIDWTTHTGQAEVTSSGVEAAITEVRWSSNTVYERVPGVSDQWIVRTPAPTARQLDGPIGLLTGLATTQRDNPQLVMQEPTAGAIGSIQIDGRTMAGYTYQGTKLWIDDTGQLRRAEAATADRRRTITVDLLALGPRSVTLPDDTEVVTAESLGSAYTDAVTTP